MQTRIPRPLCNPQIVGEHAYLAAMRAWGGAVIECGVYDGFTSAMLAWYRGFVPYRTRQFAADTFAGMPYNAKETALYKTGDLAPVDGLGVVERLRRLKIIPLTGKVEDTLPQLEREIFCFVFLDMDFEAPTWFAWNFLKDKIRVGGRIGFHDYDARPGYALPGIRMVVDGGPAKDKRFREVVRSAKRGRDGKFIFFERVGK